MHATTGNNTKLRSLEITEQTYKFRNNITEIDIKYLKHESTDVAGVTTSKIQRKWGQRVTSDTFKA
jgi:hypothetical protein